MHADDVDDINEWQAVNGGNRSTSANSLFYKFAHMHQHAKAAELLEELDLGVSVAEIDTPLETARVETSVFADLLNDKVDLVPYGLMIRRMIST